MERRPPPQGRRGACLKRAPGHAANQQTHSAFALAQARRLLVWANTTGFSAPDGLYAGSSLDPTPIDYIEAPLIYAQALLCHLAATPADCARAERLKTNALERFGAQLDFSPQYDAIYLQWMLALYSQGRRPDPLRASRRQRT